MAFHLTSRAVRIEGAYLHAECREREGVYRANRFNLDRCIGNDDGAFAWGGVNFSHSARNVVFMFPFLTAELKGCDSQWHDAEIDLSQRIENINGALRYEWGGAVGSAIDEATDGLQRFILNPLERTVTDLLGLNSHDTEERPVTQEPGESSRPRPQARSSSTPSSAPEVDEHQYEGARDLSPMTHREPEPEIGEQILDFLLGGYDAARVLTALPEPDGGVTLDFADAADGGATSAQRLSPAQIHALRAKQNAVRKNGTTEEPPSSYRTPIFNADEHIRMEDTEAGPTEAQELEAKKKAPESLKGKGVEKEEEDLVELRREVESVDTESRLDTPDFSEDEEEEWMVAKSRS